jgi:hypothetical protein
MIRLFEKFLLKRELKKVGFHWVNITPMALLDYRYQVKNNSKESTWLLERKLNRNFYLAEKVYENKERHVIHKKFGALTIIYDTYLEMIIGIVNHRGEWFEYPIDKDLKDKLNKLYKIK